MPAVLRLFARSYRHDYRDKTLGLPGPSPVGSLLAPLLDSSPSHRFGSGNDFPVVFRSQIGPAPPASTYATFVGSALPSTSTHRLANAVVSSALCVWPQTVVLHRSPTSPNQQTQHLLTIIGGSPPKYRLALCALARSFHSAVFSSENDSAPQHWRGILQNDRPSFHSAAAPRSLSALRKPLVCFLWSL